MKLSKILKLSAVASIVLANTALAQETTTSTATITVKNAFDLSETSAINFGTIRATQSFTNALDNTVDAGPPTFLNGGAGIRIKSDGTASVAIAAGTLTQPTDVNGGTGDADGTGSSEVSVIVDGAPGEYAIANAAPFTNLRITDPADSGELTNPSAPASSKFVLDIDFDDMTVVGGGNNGDAVNATGTNLLTDAAGAVGFKVGGELRIDAAALTVEDGIYTGTYIIAVNY